jgi:hypothetical protein
MAMMMTKPEFDLRAVENALEVLVLALLQERRKEKPLKAEDIKLVSIDEIDEASLKSDEEIFREEIIEKPIEGALRLAIREIGEHAFQNGISLDGLEDILECVMARNPDYHSAM